MNQFKKAKLRQIESGQPVESIADLQTAGIATKKEEKQPLVEEKTIVKKEETEDVIEDIIIETKHTEQESSAPVPVPIPVVVPHEQIITNDTSLTKHLQEIPSEAIIEQNIIEQPQIQPKELITTSSQNIVEELPNQVIQTVAPTYHEPLISTARLVARNAATVAQTQNNVTKKNIPNIFAPKDEAKSMRKSLVLKPTSVKKAENYCSKNGGSFNELIQTLLDNFIEEYGL